MDPSVSGVWLMEEKHESFVIIKIYKNYIFNKV